MDMEMFACNSDKEQIVNHIKELKQQIILLENKTSDQYKEHIVNVIKELKQEIILIENKLDELRVFYITNKGKYDNYELADTFFKNLQDFIEKERIKDKATLRYEGGDELYFIRYYSDFSRSIRNSYICYSKEANKTTVTPEQIKEHKELADKFFNLICNEEEDKLFHKMLMFEKKLKYYENRLTRLYPEKTEIKNIMDMYVEQNVLVEY